MPNNESVFGPEVDVNVNFLDDTCMSDPRVLRIHDAAAETGLTPRAIRYYESLGLLRPCARSEGDHRLYDASDLERLQVIRELRDDAGFSLAEIAQLIEDEAVRDANRAAYAATDDPARQRRLIADSLARLDRRVSIIRAKIGRLEAMARTAEERRTRAAARLAELDAPPGRSDRARRRSRATAR